MRTAKAQAAMEFLMTYGWMILVVISAIAALAYFGVLDPEKSIPETCTMPPGIGCQGFSYIDDQAHFVLRNSQGVNMENVVVSFSGANCSGYDDDRGRGR